MPEETIAGNPDHPDRTMAIGPASAGDVPMLAPEDREEQAGEMLGPFRLVERLGRGTFGSVWRAVRTEPFEQEVAIKIMRKDVGSAEGPEAVQARFDLERQVLAQLDHPGIARVFDGGVSAQGRNYFVMELVRGVPITQFCDSKRLSIRQRLDLFTQVCEAVHHAHQHGVLHRDLKPQNILAYTIDGDVAAGHSPLRAKVIDFGLAKVTMKAGAVRHQFVERGLALGTPEYMSPEQAAGDASVDARSDIYGLGAVLYELLVGAAPFDRKALRNAGLQAMVRIIRDTDPPRPSDRLSSMAAAAQGGEASSIDSVSKARGIASKQLLDALRRELNLLPMKAMRRNPADRYRSAVEMADDIRNYLDDRPLIAAPPSGIYKAKKLVRRHRGAAAAISAVALSLVVATVVSTLFFLSEREARELAQRRENEVRQVARFQSEMLTQVDPERSGIDLEHWMERRLDEVLRNEAPELSEAERAARVSRLRSDLFAIQPTDMAAAFMNLALLEPAARAASQLFPEQPTVEAALKQTIADAYRRLDRDSLPLARPLQDDAVALRTRALGPEARDTLVSIDSAGRLALALDGPAKAEPLIAAAFEARRRSLGDSDSHTRESVLSMALLRERQDRAKEAEALYRLLDAPGTPITDARRLEAMVSIGELRRRQGFPEEAVSLLSEVADAARASSSENPDLYARWLNNLGVAQAALLQVRPDDAALRAGLVKTRRECLEVSERRYGREHSASMIARDNLAVALWRARQLDEARQLGQLGVDLVERSGFSHSVDRLWLLNTLANVLFDQGKVEESLARMGEAEEIGRRILPADSRELCDLRISRMNLLERAGRGDEAIAVLRSVLRLCDERLKRTDANEDRISRVDAGTDLGERLAKRGRWSEAVAVLAESMAIAGKLRESSEARWTVTNTLLQTCRAWRAADPAAPVAAEVNAAESALPALRAARQAQGSSVVWP